MAYQSLYRRYRPGTFAEIKGQAHVVAALKGAVRARTVGHAYLLHGPRGTGKTTTARVLAKALNCDDLGSDGEPCGACESCVAIDEGRSFDLHELDAASNNKVDDMRALLEKVSLGTPGRAKVYLLDEVHMLTPGAENALLKTLEEPPEHVIWVLATTEPHKVAETIRSRCQVFELGLLGAEEMADHVRWVVADAGLDVGDEAIDHVVAAGGGSARDTLSALDRVVAAGGVAEIDHTTDRLLDALADGDPAAALSAVGEALGRGRDPRTIGESVLAGLRAAFLVAMGSPPPRLPAVESARATDLSERMRPPVLTRALETLGTSLVQMRQAPDPRVDLEVALVRLCRPETGPSLDSLVERLERLERRSGAEPTLDEPSSGEPTLADPREVAGGPVTVERPAGPVPPTADVAASHEGSDRSDPGAAASARRALEQSRPASTGRPDSATAALGASRQVAAPSISEAPPPVPPLPPVPPMPPVPPVPVAEPPTVSDPVAGVDEPVDPASLTPRTASEVVDLAQRHLGIDRATVVARAKAMLPPARGPRDPDELQPLWQALVSDSRMSRSDRPAAAVSEPDDEPVTRSPADPAPPDEDHEIDLHELTDAPSHTADMIEHLSEVFPGARLVDTEQDDST
ncbi:MAG: DNA polymerase III subunit gamma/tau [Acidimicrobiales bacterium]